MYINLVLGALALVLIILYLKKLLVREERKGPEELLAEELARRKTETAVEKSADPLREQRRERIDELTAFLEEMRLALVRQGKSGLHWERNEEAVSIAVPNKGESFPARMLVSWKGEGHAIPGQDSSSAGAGVFVARRTDREGEEEFASFAACQRYITSFIVDFLG